MIIRKLSIFNADVRKKEVLNEINQRKDFRHCLRLFVIVLSCQGLHPSDIGIMVGKSPRSIMSWIHKFNELGIVGLKDSERKGRHSRIDDEVLPRLQRDITRSPRHFGYMNYRWTGALLSSHLIKVYGIKLGIRQSQRLLNAIRCLKKIYKELPTR